MLRKANATLWNNNDKQCKFPMFYSSKAQLDIIADSLQNFQKTVKSSSIHLTTVITLYSGASYNNLSQVAQN